MTPSHAIDPKTTLAERAAAENFRKNSHCLNKSSFYMQGPTDSGATIEWIYGRDGTLTARTAEGGWWAGTSLPARLSHAMLKRLELHGSTGCFLAPFHAGAVRAALDKLSPQQSLVCILPDENEFWVMLHCADFTSALDSARLFFAAGEDWQRRLAELLDATPGLSTPSQFIRLPTLAAEITDALVPAAQRVFAEVNGRRAIEIERLRKRIVVRPEEPRLCIVAPSRFRLWNDVGQTLSELFSTPELLKSIRCFDPDKPGDNSPLALAQAVDGCAAMLTANTSRGDLPGVLADSAPWITWLTAGRIPPPPLTAAHDRLIVADATLKSTAIASGWTPSHVLVGTWPLQDFAEPAADKKLGLITDTFPLATPPDLEDYSSHRLLWETIRAELLSDPFSLPDNLHEFLNVRMARAAIDCDGLDRQRFIEKLIVPAFQQGLARALVSAGFPIHLAGAGWESDPVLAPHWRGELKTREAFASAIESISALVHVWPRRGTHPVEFAGRPVVRRTANKKSAFLRDARLALAGHATPPREHEPALPISAEMILDLLTA